MDTNKQNKQLMLIGGIIGLLTFMLIMVIWFGLRKEPLTPIPSPVIEPFSPYDIVPEKLNEKVVTVNYEGTEIDVTGNTLLIKLTRNTSKAEVMNLVGIYGVSEAYEIGLGWWSIYIPGEDIDLIEIYNNLKVLSGIEDMDFNRVTYTSLIPNDYNSTWWLAMVNSPLAWDIATGGGVVIGVIDTQIDTRHRELSGKVNQILTTSPYSWDNGSCSSSADLGKQRKGFHGTHVAGIAAAETNNGVDGSVYLASAGYDARLVGYTACWQVCEYDTAYGGYFWNGPCSGEQVVIGINSMAGSSVDVINMSFGTDSPLGGPFEDALDNVVASGIVIVAAAGNDSSSLPHYPAAYEDVMGVAARAHPDMEGRAHYSNYGNWVDVAAPGGGLNSAAIVPSDSQLMLSSVPQEQGSYMYLQGTSMASPVVAGIAALCISANPSLVNSQVMEIMQQTSALEVNGYTRYGNINAQLVVQECEIAASPTPTLSPTPGPSPTPAAGPTNTPIPVPPSITPVPTTIPEASPTPCIPPGCQPSPTPYATPLPGVGDGEMSCTVPEWYSRGPDVLLPPVRCQVGMVSVPNPACIPPDCTPSAGGDFRCSKCSEGYQIPNPVWISGLVPPTNQDSGQKDGTGKTGTEREYFYFDYHNNSPVNVPPYWFVRGGGLPVSSLATSNAYAPPYIYSTSSSVAFATNPEAPCGWPTSKDKRLVTAGCSALVGPHSSDPNKDGASAYCPDGKSFKSPALCDGSEHYNPSSTSPYTAVDIGGEFAVFSTMKGTLFRCVDMINQCDGCGSYGVYVKIIGAGYSTLYAHLLPDPELDTYPAVNGDGIGCATSDKQVLMSAVNPGDFVGYAGMSGDTPKPHLHYEIRDADGKRICPASFIDATNSVCANKPGGISLMSIIERINPFNSKNQQNIVTDEGYPFGVN